METKGDDSFKKKVYLIVSDVTLRTRRSRTKKRLWDLLLTDRRKLAVKAKVYTKEEEPESLHEKRSQGKNS